MHSSSIGPEESRARDVSHASAALRSADAETIARDQRANAAQRIAALGEMTAGIAHDFRNILAAIQAALRLAERDAHDPAAVRRFVAGAQQGVDRGVSLTSELLTFAGQQELETLDVDINGLLRKMQPLLKYASRADVPVLLALARDVPLCRINPAQFSAAILNLVVNARDATDAPGAIRIVTERPTGEARDERACPAGRYVRVRVEDEGTGIPADVIDRIFDPHFSTKGNKGTGLGLPHVLAVMHLMGGHVRIRSQVGQGTTVELLCPAMDGG
jgi:signal transduction histidine kinase